MDITVPEFLNSLIVLHGLRRIQDACIFPGQCEFFIQVEFHRSFQQQE